MGSGKRKVRRGLGRWQVERERHQIERAQPYVPARDACPIGEMMPGLMKKLGLQDQHWLEVLAMEWDGLVGEALAGHTRPGRFQRKNLTVFVDNSVWLNELSRYGRKEMLSKLQQRFGEGKIKSLDLRLDPEGLRRAVDR